MQKIRGNQSFFLLQTFVPFLYSSIETGLPQTWMTISVILALTVMTAASVLSSIGKEWYIMCFHQTRMTKVPYVFGLLVVWTVFPFLVLKICHPMGLWMNSVKDTSALSVNWCQQYQWPVSWKTAGPWKAQRDFTSVVSSWNDPTFYLVGQTNVQEFVIFIFTEFIIQIVWVALLLSWIRMSLWMILIFPMLQVLDGCCVEPVLHDPGHSTWPVSQAQEIHLLHTSVLTVLPVCLPSEPHHVRIIYLFIPLLQTRNVQVHIKKHKNVFKNIKKWNWTPCFVWLQCSFNLRLKPQAATATECMYDM